MRWTRRALRDERCQSAFTKAPADWYQGRRVALAQGLPRTTKACGPGTPGLVLSVPIGEVDPVGCDAPGSARDGD